MKAHISLPPNTRAKVQIRRCRRTSCLHNPLTGYISRFPSCYKVITFCKHTLNIFIRNTSIQNDRIPVLLILMISRYHRLIGLPPEVTPLGIHLDIHPYRPVLPLICPGKCLLILPVPDKLPVLVMKRSILICPRQRQAIFQNRFSVSQSTLLLFIYRFLVYHISRQYLYITLQNMAFIRHMDFLY